MSLTPQQIEIVTQVVKQLKEVISPAQATAPEPPVGSAAPVLEAGINYHELLEAGDGLTTRELIETISQPASVQDGMLSGVVLIEGESLNRNVYTAQALESAAKVFAGKPMFADHPTKEEQQQRPERSVRDLVGRLPLEDGSFVVRKMEAGPYAGRSVLEYRGAKLSATADWLKTLISEGIAGDQSINAVARGKEDGQGRFIVESFVDARSLDFVTQAAAGGHAVLEAAGSRIQSQEGSMPIFDEAQQRLLQLWGQSRALRRLVRVAEAEQTVLAALLAKPLPVNQHQALRDEIAPQIKAFVEAGSSDGSDLTFSFGTAKGTSPLINLPSDVMELPDDGKLEWLQAFVDGISGGEEIALHKAWARLYDAGWTKGADGWSKGMPPGQEKMVPPPSVLANGAVLPTTAPALAAYVDERISARLEAAKPEVTGLGSGAAADQSTLPGTEASAPTGALRETLTKTFERLLPHEEAVLAATGR